MGLKKHVFVLSGILFLGVVAVLRGEEMKETGFVDQVFTAPNGYEEKYVVFNIHGIIPWVNFLTFK